jgi:RNA polymerase-binding transcription factor DksA
MHEHERLKSELETRLATILGRVGRIETDLRRTPDRDWSEQATLQENDEVLESLDELGRAEVLSIRGALRRIAAGEFGLCTACRQPIEPKRLAAAPTAETCIRCADRAPREV